MWESAPRDAGATEIHSVGVLPLDEDHFSRFDGWAEFFDSEEVILIGSLLP